MPLKLFSISHSAPAKQVSHRNYNNAWWNQPHPAYEAEKARSSIKEQMVNTSRYLIKWPTCNESVPGNHHVPHTVKLATPSNARPYSTAKYAENPYLYNAVKSSDHGHRSATPSDKIVAHLVNKQRFKELAATKCPKRSLELISEILKEDEHSPLPTKKGPTA